MPTQQASTSWLTDFIASLVAASGIGYVATAYTISRWLTRTSRNKLQIPSGEGCLAWEPLDCRTEDGLRLAGWLVTPPDPKATVALFHGLRGNRGTILDRIDFLTRAGFRCVAFDHRAHGQSEGKRTSFGYYESQDVRAVLDLVGKRWPDQPCAAFGISMGAAALCYAAPHTHCCRAVILESMYYDVAHAFHSRVGRGYPMWFYRFSKGVVWMTEKRLGVRIGQLAPIDYVHKLAPSAVLFLTGGDDAVASPEDMDRLYTNCREPRELSIIPGAQHGDVAEKGGPLYRERVLDFLHRRLAA